MTVTAAGRCDRARVPQVPQVAGAVLETEELLGVGRSRNKFIFLTAPTNGGMHSLPGAEAEDRKISVCSTEE